MLPLFYSLLVVLTKATQLFPDPGNVTTVLIAPPRECDDPFYCSIGYFGGTVQYVGYYEYDGHAVVDGDVDIGPVEHLLQYAINNTANDTAIFRNRLAKRAASIFAGPSTWAGARVKYKYEDTAAQTALSADLESAIDIWPVSVSSTLRSASLLDTVAALR